MCVRMPGPGTLKRIAETETKTAQTLAASEIPGFRPAVQSKRNKPAFSRSARKAEQPR